MTLSRFAHLHTIGRTTGLSVAAPAMTVLRQLTSNTKPVFARNMPAAGGTFSPGDAGRSMRQATPAMQPANYRS